MLNLPNLMMSRGFNDGQLAKQLAVMESTVSQWRRGNASPRLDMVGKICKALDCTSDELLGLETVYNQPLSQQQSRDLMRTVTKNGEFCSEKLHQIATAIRKRFGGVSELEIWIRGIAECIYKIELVGGQPADTVTKTEVKQLNLLG